MEKNKKKIILKKAADEGGLLIGLKHGNGGIESETPSGKKIELESSEIIMNASASKKYCKELSEMNQSTGNGVAFPCELADGIQGDMGGKGMSIKDENIFREEFFKLLPHKDTREGYEKLMMLYDFNPSEFEALEVESRIDMTEEERENNPPLIMAGERKFKDDHQKGNGFQISDFKIIEGKFPDPATGTINLPASKEDRELLQNFLSFAKTIPGAIGLSANQVGINKRFCAIKEDARWIIAIEPRITAHYEDPIDVTEECLSFPDKKIKAKRWLSVSVSYFDINGTQKFEDKKNE